MKRQRRQAKKVKPEPVTKAAMRERGFITAPEAARIGKTHVQNLYRWISTGVLEHERVGVRTLYISVASLRKLVGAMMDDAGRA